MLRSFRGVVEMSLEIKDITLKKYLGEEKLVEGAVVCGEASCFILYGVSMFLGQQVHEEGRGGKSRQRMPGKLLWRSGALL